MKTQTLEMLKALLKTDDTVGRERRAEIIQACHGVPPPPPPEHRRAERWLTVRQVAHRLQVSPRTVQRRVRDGTISSRLKGGRCRRIPKSALDEAGENGGGRSTSRAPRRDPSED